jgi:hypothetical protein
MSTTIADDREPAVREDFGNYRVFSRSAIISALLIVPAGVFALYSLASGFGTEALPGVLPLPLVGAVLALVALSSIRRYPKEYAGRPLATFALVSHLGMLAVSIPTHAYIQATEVPDGYQAVSFSELQPDPEKGEYGLPQHALDLVGKEVFVKGYIHPGVASSGKVDNFILVRDFGICCFGGQPPPTHMMEVKIVGKAPRLSYSTTRMVRLAGKFFVVPPQSRETLDVQNVVYYLEADYVKH